MTDFIFVRTRTGKKIHVSSPGSSVCFCGHWLRVNATRMAVRTGLVKLEVLCERCAETCPLALRLLSEEVAA